MEAQNCGFLERRKNILTLNLLTSTQKATPILPTFATQLMQVHTQIANLPQFKKAVITIGTFDGVHLGHKMILEQVIEEANSIGGETVIITFHPHPRKIVGAGKKPIFLINTIQEKIGLLEEAGIDHLVVVPFTEDFAQLTAKEYVEDFLLKHFHPHTIIIGYDHHFGAGREGNYHLLEEYQKNGHFILKEIPEHLLRDSSVSSTRIRENILEGKIEEANELLGYSFFFEGTVVEGNKLGRTIGYPTANLEIADPEKIIPGNGVYAVEAYLGSTFEVLQGMMNIGVRPTVGGTKRVIEVNLFSFNQDIYGKVLKVIVNSFLRKEKKFDGLEGLKKQLALDKKNAQGI